MKKTFIQFALKPNSWINVSYTYTNTVFRHQATMHITILVSLDFGVPQKKSEAVRDAPAVCQCA